jgi:hypothetical protein
VGHEHPAFRAPADEQNRDYCLTEVLLFPRLQATRGKSFALYLAAALAFALCMFLVSRLVQPHASQVCQRGSALALSCR